MTTLLTTFKVGEHVRIGPIKPNGEDHPHAGKTGIIQSLHTVFLQNAWVLIDAGQVDAGQVALISLVCLEHVTLPLDKAFDAAVIQS